MTANSLFVLMCCTAAAVMLFYYHSRKRKVRSVLFGSVTGFAGLLLLEHFGGVFGGEVPLNCFNVCRSLLLGVPFDLCIVLLRIL